MRVAIYASVWPGEAVAARVSLSTQIDLCEGLVATKGWQVAGSPIVAASSSPAAGIPEAMTRLLASASAGQFAGVVVYDLGRLATSARLVLAVLRRLATAGVALATVAEGLDTSSPEGQQAFRVLLALARLADLEPVEPLPVGLLARQPLADRAGRLPYGYARGDALSVDPGRAEIVRAIFTWRAAGDSLSAIADRLTGQGVPTARGGQRWYASTVRGILAQEAIYRGGTGAELGLWPMILEEAVQVPSFPEPARDAPAPREIPTTRGRDWAVWE